MTREETIKKLKELRYIVSYSSRTALEIAIEALQERPKGRWIEKDGNAYCSECNACWGLDMYFDFEDHKIDHKFCSACGADMRESEQE